jgi:F-type H+-transporting ATPase subunit gamma
MQTIEGLKRRISVSEDLHSVVRTMKALAAVNIRQYEQAAESLKDYTETIEQGLQMLFMSSSAGPRVRARRAGDGPTGAIVYGSDQGMVGQLNEQIVEYALTELERMGGMGPKSKLIVVGERARGLLMDRGHPVEKYYTVPGSVKGVTPQVQAMLMDIIHWNENLGVEQVHLFFSLHRSSATYEPHHVHLLPVDQNWLDGIRQRQWPSRGLPGYTMDFNALFSALVRQYLFISLFQAMIESLASENASRLASMQGAERNITDQLDELTSQYHQMRQMAITEELLDIVSGFEALKT